MRLTVRRMNSEYKAMGMAGQPLATTIASVERWPCQDLDFFPAILILNF